MMEMEVEKEGEMEEEKQKGERRGGGGGAGKGSDTSQCPQGIPRSAAAPAKHSPLPAHRVPPSPGVTDGIWGTWGGHRGPSYSPSGVGGESRAPESPFAPALGSCCKNSRDGNKAKPAFLLQ